MTMLALSATSAGAVSSTFKDLYAAGLSVEKACALLDAVFVQQLGRLYTAAKRDRSAISFG